ncbi:MAG: hypothetical protein MZU97_17725 [Bacillus subtilis]|nr:hypothetical protein [Bacillus subtilis]
MTSSTTTTATTTASSITTTPATSIVTTMTWSDEQWRDERDQALAEIADYQSQILSLWGVLEPSLAKSRREPAWGLSLEMFDREDLTPVSAV